MERVRARVPGVSFAVDGVGVMGHEPEFYDSTYLVDDGSVHIGDLAPLLDRDVVKLIARVEGLPALDLAAQLDEEVLDGVAVPYHGAGEWVELLPVGVSKASGLAMLCSQLGVAPDEVVAVGDGWNDIPMLSWAGVGVAMSGAAEAVLEAADRVVPSALEDGVAVLLDELLERA
jgi:hydroxymethylpyrimidine pyrophosphatase-like HAD family hydrolase